MNGLRAALVNLKGAGCQTAYINGSFVTRKELPNDYDACWEETGVDPEALRPRSTDPLTRGGPCRRPSTWGVVPSVNHRCHRRAVVS